MRKFVFKSSAHYYGCEQDDPAFFTEDMRRRTRRRPPIERDIVEAESAVRDFAERNPGDGHRLRFANGLGPDLRTSCSRLFGLPAVPTILGFDPRQQFIHEDDIVGCLEHAVRNDLARRPQLRRRRRARAVGDRRPARQAVRAAPAAVGHRPGRRPARSRLGLRLPPEMLRQLRFGRGLDNRRFKATGFRYRFTTRETVLRLGEHQRIAPILRGAQPRATATSARSRSSCATAPASGQRPSRGPGRAAQHRGRGRPAPTPALDDLEAHEIVALLPSLDPAGPGALHEHEDRQPGSPEVIVAIERLQPWEPARNFLHFQASRLPRTELSCGPER